MFVKMCMKIKSQLKPQFFHPRNPNSMIGGELILGGFDHSHFSGNLNWIPVTKQGYWQIQLDK